MKQMDIKSKRSTSIDKHRCYRYCKSSGAVAAPICERAPQYVLFRTQNIRILCEVFCFRTPKTAASCETHPDAFDSNRIECAPFVVRSPAEWTDTQIKTMHHIAFGVHHDSNNSSNNNLSGGNKNSVVQYFSECDINKSSSIVIYVCLYMRISRWIYKCIYI